MTLRRTAVLAVLGVGALLWLLLATHEWGLGTRADGSPRWKYLLEDEHDRDVYQQRGRWLPGHLAPYLEEHSEYPQLATLLLGVPYLFFDSHVPVGRSQTVQEFRAHPEDTAAYFDLHHVDMAVGLLALILLTALVLRELGRPPALALLLFLPATAYYSFNRFDAWPSLLVVAALLCQLRGRTLAAALLLALGAMTKWYPILLLPLFLSHNLYGRGDRRPWLARVPRAVLAPGLLAAAVCVGILSITWFWHGGGLAAVKYVYGPKGQGDRVPNPGSIIFALTSPSMWGWFAPSDQDWLARIATIAQFLPAVVMAFVPLRSREALLAACLVVVLGFMQFGKVFSPQWIVWVAPLAILVGSERRAALLLLVAADVLTYVQTPLCFYEFVGNPAYTEIPGRLVTASSLRIAALAAFWAWSLWALLRTLGRPQGESVAAPARASG
jgi:hypothetical protein